MDDRCAGSVDAPAQERRRAVRITFLGAGMYSPPSKALIVEVLAGARRAVALHQPHGQALDEWLAGEVRLRGSGRTLLSWLCWSCCPDGARKLPGPTAMSIRTALACSVTCWQSLTSPVPPRV
jgi:hypothetical protein